MKRIKNKCVDWVPEAQKCIKEGKRVYLISVFMFNMSYKYRFKTHLIALFNMNYSLIFR